MIEINPFDPATSACLFSWGSPADAAILHGAAPFEFRVVAAPREGVLELVVPSVRGQLQGEVRRLRCRQGGSESPAPELQGAAISAG